MYNWSCIVILNYFILQQASTASIGQTVLSPHPQEGFFCQSWVVFKFPKIKSCKWYCAKLSCKVSCSKVPINISFASLVSATVILLVAWECHVTGRCGQLQSHMTPYRWTFILEFCRTFEIQCARDDYILLSKQKGPKFNQTMVLFFPNKEVKDSHIVC